MKKPLSFLSLLAIVISFSSCKTELAEKSEPSDILRFEGTAESLQQYECPEWFRDAKFGIYMYWGVYSVAEMGKWYARNLYIEGEWWAGMEEVFHMD